MANRRNAVGQSRWAIAAILSLTLIKGILWSAAVPVWQAPDEPSHFAVVQFIAEFGRLPGPGDARMSKEIVESMGLSDFGRMALRSGGRQRFSMDTEGLNEASIRDIPWQNRLLPNARSTAMHLPPLYYIIGAFAYRLVYADDVLVRLFAVRQVSVALAAITVFLAYRIARLVFPDSAAMQVTVPIMVSFHPMFTFSGAVVNTDIMLITLSSWATYLLLSIVQSGFTARRIAGLGLALGLGVLTKPQIWFVLPPFAVVVVLELGRRRVGLRRMLMLLTLMLVVCLMVCGWWFIRAQVLNRNVFYAELRSSTDPQPDAELAEYLWVYEARLLDGLFRSYWGRFGWLDTDMSRRDYYLVRLAVQFALVGVGIHVGRLLARRRLTGTEWSLLVQGAYAATFVAAFALLGFWVYRKYGSVQPSQGRYFLAPLVSQMTLLAVGLLAFVPRRWHKVGHLVLQAGIILLNVSALFGALIPRYYVP